MPSGNCFSDPKEVPMDYIMGRRTSFMKPIPYFVIPMVFYILLSGNLENSFLVSFYEGISEPDGEAVNPEFQGNLAYLLTIIKDQRLFIFTTVIALSISYKWFFPKMKLNFAEHVVFSLYAQGHVLLLSLPILIFVKWISEDFMIFAYLLGLIYSVWATKRFYQTNIIKSFFAYIVGYAVYYMIVIAGFFIFLVCLEVVS